MDGRRRQLPRGLHPTRRTASARGLHLLRRLVTLLLLLLALESPCLPAAALSLPWRPTPAARPSAAESHGLAPLQEVSAPEAVQQLQAALAARQPVIEILSPLPDSVLTAGPWILRLRVHDWPLVESGSLGLGPHLVVQLDQEPPRIWTSSEGELPELSPGSHRLSVYAALPWGEARKNPGAMRQIQLHRTAPNPLALPAPGSPQLLAVSPGGTSGAEPLLLDWLLLDAPLQDIGGSGTQWRLRVTINGDAFLLDQQSPLWLRGWRPGLNSLRLELLDGHGEPLNQPFNSLVQEVELQNTGAAPRWRGGPLSAAELAILMGEVAAVPPADGQTAADDQTPPAPGNPAAASIAAASAATSPSTAAALSPMSTLLQPVASDQRSDTSPDPSLGANASGELTGASPPPYSSGPQPSDSPLSSSKPDRSSEANRMAVPPAGIAAPDAPSAGMAAPESGAPKAMPEGQTATAAGRATAGQDQTFERGEAGEVGSQPPLAFPGAAASSPDGKAGWIMERSASGSEAPPPPTNSATGDDAMATATAPPGPDSSTLRAGSEAVAAGVPSHVPPADLTATPAMPPTPLTEAPPQQPPTAGGLSRPDDGNEERVRPSTELSSRARDLVNDDGTLRRPERRGPLAGLREWLRG